jgi:hypothetical protein
VSKVQLELNEATLEKAANVWVGRENNCRSAAVFAASRFFSEIAARMQLFPRERPIFSKSQKITAYTQLFRRFNEEVRK